MESLNWKKNRFFLASIFQKEGLPTASQKTLFRLLGELHHQWPAPYPDPGPNGLQQGAGNHRPSRALELGSLATLYRPRLAGTRCGADLVRIANLFRKWLNGRCIFQGFFFDKLKFLHFGGLRRTPSCLGSWSLCLPTWTAGRWGCCAEGHEMRSCWCQWQQKIFLPRGKCKFFLICLELHFCLIFVSGRYQHVHFWAT